MLFQNLKELEFINKYLGGHSISIQGINEVVIDRSKKYNIIDIGCGGGDSLKAIAAWSIDKNIKINFSTAKMRESKNHKNH